MKEHLATPNRLVNIKNIKELGGIHDSGGGLRIGATVTLDEFDGERRCSQELSGADAGRAGCDQSADPQYGNCRRRPLPTPRCWYYRGGFGLFGKNLIPMAKINITHPRQ